MGEEAIAVARRRTSARAFRLIEEPVVGSAVDSFTQTHEVNAGGANDPLRTPFQSLVQQVYLSQAAHRMRLTIDIMHASARSRDSKEFCCSPHDANFLVAGELLATQDSLSCFQKSKSWPVFSPINPFSLWHNCHKSLFPSDVYII